MCIICPILIQYSNFKDFKQRKKDHISYVGNRAQYSFIELDMSTGPMNNQPRETIFIYICRYRARGIELCELKDAHFSGGDNVKMLSSSMIFRAQLLIELGF